MLLVSRTVTNPSQIESIANALRINAIILMSIMTEVPLAKSLSEILARDSIERGKGISLSSRAIYSKHWEIPFSLFYESYSHRVYKRSTA